MDVHPPRNGIFIGIDPYPVRYVSRYESQKILQVEIAAAIFFLGGATSSVQRPEGAMEMMGFIGKKMGVSENRVPLFTQWLMIKPNGFHDHDPY